MNTPAELYHRARELGLTLKPAGELLVIQPKGKCPPELLALLAEHKRAILDWLRSPPSGPLPDLGLPADYFTTFPKVTRAVPDPLPAPKELPPDQMPWLHIAKQILAGEFEEADLSTQESLLVGLRATEHPLCRRAIMLVNGKP